MHLQPLLTDLMLELHVPDFAPAKDFYGAIGFELVWQKEISPSPDYMVMRRGRSILNFYGGNESVFKHHHFGSLPNDSPRGYGVEIIIPIDNIKQFYEEFSAIRPDSVVKPLNHDHSHADFRVVDPFGYYLRFVERYNWVDGRTKQGTVINDQA